MFTIICPTDFSDVANNAIEYAVKLASQLKARVHLFHLIHPSYLNSDTEGMFIVTAGLEDQIALSDKKLESLKSKFESFNVNISTSSEFGFWEDALSGLEDKYKPNLFITGTKGASSIFTAKLIGQNSLEFAKKLKCPVLIIPQYYTLNSVQNIVYATDYQFNDIDFAKYVIKIANFSNAKIEYVHVTNNRTQKYEDEYMDWLQDLISKETSYSNLDFKIITGDSVEKTLENYSQKNHIDILCVSSRNKNFFQELFSHNYSDNLIIDAKLPILVFHLNENFRM